MPKIAGLVATAIVIAGLHFAKEVLIPIALSMLLSFLLAPFVARLERRGMARVPAVLGGVATIMVGLVALGWFVFGRVGDLVDELPQYRTTLQQKVEDLRGRFGRQFGRAADVVEELGEDLDAAAKQPSPEVVVVEVAEPSFDLNGWLRDAALGIARGLGFAAIVFLFVTFMLLQREALRDRVIWLVGDHRLNVTTQMLEDASRRVGSYLLAQLVVNTIHGTFVGIGLASIGVPNALFWALLAGLLRFLPYVGPWIGALCPILLSFAVFEGWTKPLTTIGLFVVLEVITNNVIEPWMYAARTGMSSLAILISAFFWTWLWGPIGLLLATPLTVCLVVMGKYVPQLRGFTVMLGDGPVLSPAARFYQRVLAGDGDGAREVLFPRLKAAPLVEVYDEIVMPALRLAAQDCRSGELEETRREALERNLALLVEEAAARAEREPARAESDATKAVPLAGRPLRLLCVPTTDALDQIAANMLREALRPDAIEVEMLTVGYFASEVLEIVAQRKADAVCISHVPPPALTPVRYLTKRLVEKHPDLPVIVGAWTAELDESGSDLRLPPETKLHVVGTLARARVHALHLFQQVSLGPQRAAERASGDEAQRAPADPRRGTAPSGA